jgi:hypothetical protein
LFDLMKATRFFSQNLYTVTMWSVSSNLFIPFNVLRNDIIFNIFYLFGVYLYHIYFIFKFYMFESYEIEP